MLRVSASGLAVWEVSRVPDYLVYLFAAQVFLWRLFPVLCPQGGPLR